ncbi:hypothetical protein [Streptomyces sp. WZ-12]|uniref:hypothetical protein n=1 Tax=Streptomyces sp. WZ-12 TaxID=3030210 RepID=UPI0023811CCB|nr:hypothetical protein [Streptomyces sp. WZ-12]
MPNPRPFAPPPWPAPPQPHPGCAYCAEIGGQRATARQEYDRSAESDCNVRLRRHLKEVHA